MVSAAVVVFSRTAWADCGSDNWPAAWTIALRALPRLEASSMVSAAVVASSRTAWANCGSDNWPAVWAIALRALLRSEASGMGSAAVMAFSNIALANCGSDNWPAAWAISPILWGNPFTTEIMRPRSRSALLNCLAAKAISTNT